MDEKTVKPLKEESEMKDSAVDPPSQVPLQATNLTDRLRAQLGLKAVSGGGMGFMRREEKSVSSISHPTVTGAKADSMCNGHREGEDMEVDNGEGEKVSIDEGEQLRQRAIEEYLSKRE